MKKYTLKIMLIFILCGLVHPSNNLLNDIKETAREGKDKLVEQVKNPIKKKRLKKIIKRFARAINTLALATMAIALSIQAYVALRNDPSRARNMFPMRHNIPGMLAKYGVKSESTHAELNKYLANPDDLHRTVQESILSLERFNSQPVPEDLKEASIIIGKALALEHACGVYLETNTHQQTKPQIKYSLLLEEWRVLHTALKSAEHRIAKVHEVSLR